MEKKLILVGALLGVITIVLGAFGAGVLDAKTCPPVPALGSITEYVLSEGIFLLEEIQRL